MALVKLNNRGVRSVTDFGGTTALGTYTFIKKITASSSATVSFVDGSSDVVLDNTYKEYVFTCKNIHPQTTNSEFRINFRDGGSAYDATKTTTFIKTRHAENDAVAATVYDDGGDVVGTGGHLLMENVGADNDASCCGIIYLFDPSSTTFVKHFTTDFTSMSGDPMADRVLSAGYINVTAAIDGVQFAFDAGNIDVGDFCLYGLTT